MIIKILRPYSERPTTEAFYFMGDCLDLPDVRPKNGFLCAARPPFNDTCTNYDEGWGRLRVASDRRYRAVHLELRGAGCMWRGASCMWRGG